VLEKAILETKQRVPQPDERTATHSPSFLDSERQLVLELNSITKTVIDIDVGHRIRAF
jgi:hypothetical protein